MVQVSVITPAFNAGATLEETINSVQRQTFEDWELIIVDDGSTDHTSAIATMAAQDDPRIKYVKQPNKGAAAARRLGFQQAQGRYIAFLDSDDLWLPEKLEKQLAFMHEFNAAISYTAYRRFKDNDQLGEIIIPPTRLTHKDLLGNSAIPNLTAMIDRNILPNIVIPDIPRAEDFAMWLQLLRRCGVAYGLIEDLARYRVSKTSASARRAGSAVYVWNILRQQERLSVLAAALYFISWGLNALQRHSRF